MKIYDEESMIELDEHPRRGVGWVERSSRNPTLLKYAASHWLGACGIWVLDVGWVERYLRNPTRRTYAASVGLVEHYS